MARLQLKTNKRLAQIGVLTTDFLYEHPAVVPHGNLKGHVVCVGNYHRDIRRSAAGTQEFYHFFHAFPEGDRERYIEGETPAESVLFLDRHDLERSVFDALVHLHSEESGLPPQTVAGFVDQWYGRRVLEAELQFSALMRYDLSRQFT